MRILFVSNLFPPDVIGGYEMLASDVAIALRARGHEVVVLTTGRARESDPSWVERGLELIRPFGEPGQLDRLRHLQAAGGQVAIAEEVLSARGPFDAVLYSSLRRLGLHIPRALDERGLRSVWMFNDDWLLAHAPGIGATSAKRAAASFLERGPFAARTWRGVTIDRAIYPSAAIRTALEKGGAPVPTGVVCFQGVDRALFAPRRFRPLPPTPTLMFAGRLHPTKGCELAVDATARLRESGIEARLLIAGRGDEAYERTLRERAAPLADAVEFLGFVPRKELPSVYARADAFVFPSLWEEPAGLTYLEAMSCAVPVVGLARGGARELFVDGKNALVADDAEGIAAAVRRLIEDPILSAEVVRGGDLLVEGQASLVLYVDAIERELLEAAGTRAA